MEFGYAGARMATVDHLAIECCWSAKVQGLLHFAPSHLVEPALQSSPAIIPDNTIKIYCLCLSSWLVWVVVLAALGFCGASVSVLFPSSFRVASYDECLSDETKQG